MGGETRKRNKKHNRNQSLQPEDDNSNRPDLRRTPSFKERLQDQLTKKELTEDGQPKFVTRRRVMFIFGILVGFLTAGFFASPHGQKLAAPYVSTWSQYFNESFDMGEIDWRGMLPDNINVEEIFANFTGRFSPDKQIAELPNDTPGAKLKDKGAAPKHPVLFIPGIISTGLESWSFDDCSKKYFRKRLWGTLTMFRSVLVDRECWLQALKLDEITGLDPPGFKLRASQGFEAADYFVSGYWIWAKFIENFAILGYDNNNMHLASYDWRLAYENLEVRDQYFTKLKYTIEVFKRGSKEKAVVLTHSMGGLVWYYFLKWVESEHGGGGGPNWVEDHIHATANIAGALLGASKTIPSLLSGEQRETVQPMAQYVLEKFFSRKERASLFRAWGGLWSLIPKGGETIWGNHESAPDDHDHDPNSIQGTNPSSFGDLFVLPYDSTIGHNLTVSEAINILMGSVPNAMRKNVERQYSYGVALSDDEIRNEDPAAWSNPLETSLPVAPSMKMYCFYGYGLDTERAYHISETPALEALDEKGLPFVVDASANGIGLESGIKTSEGDGSVPLLSLGYMCVEGWKKPRFNPANLTVITREFNHTALPLYEDIRGGPKTSEHIDILGNHELTMDLLKVASGYDDQLTDRIESQILKYARRVPL